MIDTIKTYGDYFFYAFSVLGILGLVYYFSSYFPESRAGNRSQILSAEIRKTTTVHSPPSKLKDMKNIGLLEELSSRQMTDQELVQKAIQDSNIKQAERGMFGCNP